MNEEQKFEVGDLVKLQSWIDYRPIESINDGYISFVDNSLLGDHKRIAWYNTYNHKFTKYVEKENEMQNIESKKDTQENKTEDTFKVGDVVWCVIYGKGVVKNIVGQYATYPVVVDFENGVHLVTYTHDGKVSSSAQRTLFFSEPKIEALTTRPFTPTLIGKKIVVTVYNGSLFVGEVIDEDKDLILFQCDEYVKKNLIKELYILGENVVNSIK